MREPRGRVVQVAVLRAAAVLAERRALVRVPAAAGMAAALGAAVAARAAAPVAAAAARVAAALAADRRAAAAPAARGQPEGPALRLLGQRRRLAAAAPWPCAGPGPRVKRPRRW